MLQPFRLTPTYRDYVWGGKRLRPDADITAEAWIIYENDLVADGPYAGQTLADIAAQESAALLGKKPVTQTGDRFPLLVKLLDCAKWLSLQVHPNDEQAEALEGSGHFGETEAWYVVDAAKNAQLLSGFCPGVTQEDIRRTVGKKEMLEIVESRTVKVGDTIYITPGTIHALGPGLLIYEVQQTSDLTYRVYDWDRPMTGRRQLHIEQATAVLNPSADGNVLSRNPQQRKNEMKRLVTSRYFALDLIPYRSQPLRIDLRGESFSAITALADQVLVNGPDWCHELKCFESLLVPANCGEFSIQMPPDATALHAFVP